MKRTSIFLADKDFDALKIIQSKYGVSTASDAIRLAIRVLAHAENISISPLPNQKLSKKP